MPSGVPPEVAAIRAEIRRFLDSPDASGRKIGNAKYGAYDSTITMASRFTLAKLRKAFVRGLDAILQINVPMLSR